MANKGSSMTKQMAGALILAAMVLVWHPVTADAASITVLQSGSVPAAPGATIGFDYRIETDANRDLILTSIDAQLLGDSQVFAGLFDLPLTVTAAIGSVIVPYDPLNLTGLELMLSPLLSPGDIVSVSVYGTYLLRDPAGLIGDSQVSFEVPVTTRVVAAPAVPEPATLLLIGAGLAAAIGRRHRTVRL
jgi:hypothetical protein